MANLPHVTAQPDLLPWNATGCCAGDKKRQRLKLQGGNTPWSWRAAQLGQEGKKKVLRVSTHTPSSPALHSLPDFPTPPTVITSGVHSPPTMTHVHTHIVLTRYWRVIRGVLGGVLHTIYHPPFSLCLSLSPFCLQCLKWSLSCSTVSGPHLVHRRTGYTESSHECQNRGEDKQYSS